MHAQRAGRPEYVAAAEVETFMFQGAGGASYARAIARLARRTFPLRIKTRRLKAAEREDFAGPALIPERRRVRERRLTFRETVEYVVWTLLVSGAFFGSLLLFL